MTRFALAFVAASIMLGVPGVAQAQIPTQRPTAAQAQAALTDPAIRARVLAQIKASGMSPEQISSTLRSMGYSDDIINQIIGGPGVDTTAAFSEDAFAA